jgi:hypothetical protein
MCLLLAACASNLPQVSTFGRATQSLSDQTTSALSRYAGSCREREGLARWQSQVFGSAIQYWQAQSATSAPAARAAAATHLDELVEIKRQTDLNIGAFERDCPRQQAALVVIPKLSLVLAEYARALQALASDNFVSYNGQLDVADAIGKVAVPGQTPLLNAAQMRAVDQLSGLIYTMATQSYRQHKLKEVLGEDVRSSFRALTGLLQSLAGAYRTSLAFERVQLQGFSSDLSKALLNGDLPEPVAVAELKSRLDAQSAALDAIPGALTAYADSLTHLDAAFLAARESIDHPGALPIARSILDFAKAAYHAEAALQAAFRGE